MVDLDIDGHCTVGAKFAPGDTWYGVEDVRIIGVADVRKVYPRNTRGVEDIVSNRIKGCERPVVVLLCCRLMDLVAKRAQWLWEWNGREAKQVVFRGNNKGRRHRIMFYDAVYILVGANALS